MRMAKDHDQVEQHVDDGTGTLERAAVANGFNIGTRRIEHLHQPHHSGHRAAQQQGDHIEQQPGTLREDRPAAFGVRHRIALSQLHQQVAIGSVELQVYLGTPESWPELRWRNGRREYRCIDNWPAQVRLAEATMVVYPACLRRHPVKHAGLQARFRTYRLHHRVDAGEFTYRCCAVERSVQHHTPGCCVEQHEHAAHQVVVFALRLAPQSKRHQHAGRQVRVDTPCAIVTDRLQARFAQLAIPLRLQGTGQKCTAPLSPESHDPLIQFRRIVELLGDIGWVVATDVHALDQCFKIIGGQPVHDQLPISMSDGSDRGPPQ
ncbi:hypothetical protein D3C76_668750 [compost metagenome]